MKLLKKPTTDSNSFVTGAGLGTARGNPSWINHTQTERMLLGMFMQSVQCGVEKQNFNKWLPQHVAKAAIVRTCC